MKKVIITFLGGINLLFISACTQVENPDKDFDNFYQGSTVKQAANVDNINETDQDDFLNNNFSIENSSFNEEEKEINHVLNINKESKQNTNSFNDKKLILSGESENFSCQVICEEKEN